ncbi:MAG: histidine--tRNA ligase [Thermoprotei archaeon]|nr:MAG: histidine--tRNA ligase [Thermoprotei archaeon]RLE56807.1 MAG: histidine--tRNA ligase [Thermoprotei archaeon]
MVDTRLQRPRGTRDYLPLDCFKRRVVIERIRSVFERFGYGEVLTPAFEHLELLEAKAGSEVREQIYWFEDKAGRKLGLRFEMTTPIARIVATMPHLPKPIRFYYIAPVWRYEEPQLGRLREFWQAGIELIGSPHVEADAEVIAVTWYSLRDVGLEDERIEVRFSSRALADRISDALNIPRELREDFYRYIDKYHRYGIEYVVKGLESLGISRENIEKVRELLMIEGSNEEKIELLDKLFGSTIRTELEKISTLLDLLKSYNVKNVVLDLSIVRGLAYYTGTVFEVYVKGQEDVGSIAGGGRYDDLIELVGGSNLPATGMAIGIERLIEVLERLGKLPTDYPRPVAAVVTPKMDLYSRCLEIANLLRQHGIPCIVDVMRRSLRANLEYAVKIGAKFLVIVGEKELKLGKVAVKNLTTGKQMEVSIHELPTFLKRDNVVL